MRRDYPYMVYTQYREHPLYIVYDEYCDDKIGMTYYT